MSDEPWKFFANSEETMGAHNRSSIYLIDISVLFVTFLLNDPDDRDILCKRRKSAT